MRKAILIAGFPAEEEKILRQVGILQGCRVYVIGQASYALTPAELLAGKDAEPGADDSSAVISRFLLMAGFERRDLDSFLAVLRKSSVGQIPYKAMLTPTNQNWRFDRLYQEIVREHEAMHRG